MTFDSLEFAPKFYQDQSRTNISYFHLVHSNISQILKMT